MSEKISHIRSIFIPLVLICLCAALAAGQQAVLENDLKKSFSGFELIRLDQQEALRSRIENRQKLAVAAADRTYELELFPRDLRAPGYRAETTLAGGDRRPLATGKVTTFKGRVANDPDSTVRLAVDGDRVEGFFRTGGRQYFIEPAARYSIYAGPGDHVVYRSGSFLNSLGIACESDLAKRIKSGKMLFGGGQANLTERPRVLRIATEADFELVNSSGGAGQANGRILSLLNMIEGTYESDLNLVFSVVYQHAWTTTTPYANTTTAVLLDAFQAHWQANFPPAEIGRDLAYYFTGKSNRAGMGMSKFSQLCNPHAAYGLSGDISNFEANSVLMAHEIGHIIGANHAEAAQNCANTIMNQMVSNITPLTFCGFSRNEITNNISLNGGCLTEQSSAAVRFDFDGDGRADRSVFRPSNGVWYIDKTTAGLDVFQFGQDGDRPAAADFDGDGMVDAAVYRDGAWYSLNSSDGAFRAVSFGYATDIPTPADFDGDGRAEIAVFRPENGTWYSLRSSDGAYTAVQFGAAGDQPVPGDFDGDGRADISLFRPANGTWYRIDSSTGGFFAAQFGQQDDLPLAGDFDGDGRRDLAVWRPSNGGWYYLHSSTGGFTAIGFGLPTDIPVPGDYDGDGRTDISVFRPADGFWHLLSSGSNNSYSATPFGSGSDLPVPSF